MHCDFSVPPTAVGRAPAQLHHRLPSLICLLVVSLVAGCGTTRISDTMRTGTEQMLLSTAIERAVNDMDFSLLEGKDVFFDPQYLKGVSDEGYIVSSIRQRLLAEGARLKVNRDDAIYVVEARAGTVGTNRQDVLIGVPQVSLPSGGMITGVPSAIPEIPLAKKTQQKGIVKLAAFAYNQVTGQGVWQSGTYPIIADSRDTWILGTGPFQRGSIYAGTNFAGQRVGLLGGKKKSEMQVPAPGISITAAASFGEDEDLFVEKSRALAQKKERERETKATPASFTPMVPNPPPQPATSAAPTSGFSSSTFGSGNGSQDAKATSGGSAAAAGLMILQNRASQ